MTINIRRATNVKAVGHHVNGNSKPVFCITDGAVYASVTDAAEKVGANPSTMSFAITNNTSCKGKRYCFIANVMEHLDEISTNIHTRNEKVAAYDAIVAKENAKKEAAERFAKHQARYAKLRAELEKEERLMQEANALCNS